jgi:signal transduction histidine kinase
VKNLIENAVHHSRVGGVVTIRLAASGISVRDIGPGVAPDDVPKLFTRFWRSAAAPYEGAGLGLSICQTIAVAHGWKVSYRLPTEGPGAEFTVAF